MAHTIREHKPLLARVRRLQGQLRGLESLLENGAECSAVLQQIAAVRGATNGLMHQVLEGHIREHLGASDANAEQRARDVEHVLAALHSYLK